MVLLCLSGLSSAFVLADRGNHREAMPVTLISAGTYEVAAANQPRLNRQPPTAPDIQLQHRLLVVQPCPLERFLQTRRNSHATMDRFSIH